MTREDIKTITDIVHKTIYGFFDICGDDEETPITDKDKLLLSINKAICSNIRALEQKPCGDAIDRSEAIYIASGYCHPANIAKELAKLPPVTPEPKMGRWIAHSDGIFIKYYECSECGKVHDTQSDYCEKCGIRMVEPQEREVEE